MFKQIYQSAPAQYRTLEQAGLVGYQFGIGLQSSYAPYLLEPPRIYPEEFSRFIALWVTPDKTTNGQGEVHLSFWLNQVSWPGWGIRTFHWDLYTGAFTGSTASSFGQWYYGGTAYQMPDDSIWTHNVFGEIYKVSLTDPSVGLAEPVVIPAWAEFRQPGWSPYAFMVYASINRAVTFNVPGELHIREFDTGVILKTVLIGAEAHQIIGIDTYRLLAFCTNGITYLVNYSLGTVIARYQTAAPQTGTIYAWDRIRNRLLSMTPTPNAEDGQCTLNIKGWYPVPLATGLTKPIALRPLRKGRKIPLVSFVYDDVGNQIGGIPISGVATGDAVLDASNTIVDNRGRGFLSLTGSTEGSVDVTVSAPVQDQSSVVNEPSTYIGEVTVT